MSQLLPLRGRLAILLAVLMLVVAALAIVLLHQLLVPPQPPTWDQTVFALLSDPLLGGSPLLADPSTGGGPLGADALVPLGAWLLLVPVCARVAWVVAGRIARPLVVVADAAEAAGPGNMALRLSLGGSRDDEYRRLGEAFNGLMDRFEEHDAERRRLVDDAAHEVRNPLAVMRTSLDVALADPDDAEALRAAAEVSQRAGERIARTLDSLQGDFRERAPHPARSAVDLGAVVRELASDYGGAAARRGVGLELRAPAGLLVSGDRDPLRRALENLLVNAIRFAPPGSSVVVGAGSLGGWCWLGVRDFGPGIAPGDQALVFARGWRGSGPEMGPGRGLGLALVRQIAEAHGGTVRLTSVPRGGSSFVVWLPADESDGGGRVGIDSVPDPLWWPISTASPSAPSAPQPAPRRVAAQA